MTAEAKQTELRTPNYFPYCNRVLATHPFPFDKSQPGVEGQPTTWFLGHPHPFIPEMTVVRMFILPGSGVEVFSLSKDGTVGSRITLPWHMIRLTEEVFSPSSFLEEITDADTEAKGEGESPETAPAPNGITPLPAAAGSA